MDFTKYDIIGDIHGQADKLKALLKKLGYQEINGVWKHPERKAFFVGDFVDRGPKQLETLHIVRNMVEAGAALAVMGNHELNAIAWNTPDTKGLYLRPRHGDKGEKNRRQHAAFLKEVEDTPTLHKSWTDWFLTLPLFEDRPECRVIHACWHQPLINQISPRLKDGRFLSQDLLLEALTAPEIPTHAGSNIISLFDGVEILLKGLEISLPPGQFYFDAEDNKRTQTRARWWDHSANTYAEAALLPAEIRSKFPHIVLQEHEKVSLDEQKPTFFGHYWMTGTPQILSSSVACVDYSAARHGPLVAYQLNEPGPLSSDHFVSADMEPLASPSSKSMFSF